MLQFAPCLSKIDLVQDIPVLVENGVEMITINENEIFLDASDKKLVEIRKIFEEAGIEIHSVHGPGSKDLISFDPGLRNQSVEKFSRLIRHLSIAGVGIMVFHGGQVENENHLASAFSLLLESLEQLVKVAEEHHIVIALENDPYQESFPRGFCGNSRILLKLLESIDSPWLKACFDTGHAHINEGAQERIGDAIRNLGIWITTFHIHDNDGSGDLHIQPGYGTLNWDEFVSALQDIQYEGSMTIESEPWAGGTYRCMLEEVKALLKDSGADIPDELTLKPKADWLKNFPSGWKNSDLVIRCQRCGHYIVWTPDGGHCACKKLI